MSELTIQILKHSEEECHSLIGGNSSNPTWKEYLEGFQKDYRPHFILLKKCIEDNGLLGETGEGIQNQGISFKFSDGQHWSFSWRGWGDLMQSIVNKKEGYMRYYM